MPRTSPLREAGAEIGPPATHVPLSFAHTWTYSGDAPLQWIFYNGPYWDYGALNLSNMAKLYFGGSVKSSSVHKNRPTPLKVAATAQGKVKDLDKDLDNIFEEPSFWCKALPKCPLGAGDLNHPLQPTRPCMFSIRKHRLRPPHASLAVCSDTAVTSVGTSTDRGIWSGRILSANSGWNMAPKSFSAASAHIRCWDLYAVYRYRDASSPSRGNLPNSPRLLFSHLARMFPAETCSSRS